MTEAPEMLRQAWEPRRSDQLYLGDMNRVRSTGLHARYGIILAAVAQLLIGAACAAASLPGSQAPAPTGAERPLPEVAALMREVEANQRSAEAVEKDYIYHSVSTMEQTDSHGGVKKRETRDFDVFWLRGVPVRKLLRKNGVALTTDELRKEDERIERDVRKAQDRREARDAKGKQTDPRGNEEVTVSRILELGSFSNPRRLGLQGRNTIAVDYTGDPKAKTRNRAEEVIRTLTGTVWIDEADHVLVRVEGRFVSDFKVGGGLVANIRKGTHFGMEQRRVNGEVWLPETIEGQGAARMMLFFAFDGRLRVVNSDFRKFKASATILPGVGRVEE